MGIWSRIADFAHRALDPDDCDPARDPSRDVDFTMAVIALGAKLAKADGRVTGDEVTAFQRVFQTPPGSEGAAARVFDLAARTTLGFEGYARRLARRWACYPALLEDVLDALFYIAASDGRITDDELAYLARVADLFGLSASEMRRLQASWLGVDSGDPYAILGVEPDIDDADLRRAYHRLVAANHPDRAAGRGLPASAERLATEKMATINAAYNAIRRARGDAMERAD